MMGMVPTISITAKSTIPIVTISLRSNPNIFYYLKMQNYFFPIG
jgi:hypothetical protein